MLAPRSRGGCRSRDRRGHRGVHARRLARSDAAERGRCRGAEGRGARPGTPVYLSAVPTRPQEEVVAQAARRARGRARAGAASRGAQLRLADALKRFLDRLAGEAGVRRLLVIAGDRAEPAGPFHGALEAINSGLISRSGIARSASRAIRMAIRASPTTSSTALLAAKLEAAAQTGLKVKIVTQFCLDAAPILAWVKRLRDHGIDHPVRIGLAGPDQPRPR